MKIKLIEPLGVEENVIRQLATKFKDMGHEFCYYSNKTTDVDELKKRVCDANILMIANNPLPNEVISEAEKLEMISVAFTGIDHIGKEAIREKEIMVCNSAGYSNDSVAELVIGLTIDLLRNISTCNQVTRNGGTIKGLVGSELKGKTIGIIGTGKIGLTVAKLYKAFGCKLIGFTPHPSEAGKEIGIQYMSIEEVMSQSDIVTLHLPLKDSTRGFISRERLSLMKETAIIINCARGPVVDNKALAEFLNEGLIAGAGIDVFDMEPPIPSDYVILSAKNTILTPHVAFATKESMIKRAEIVFENVVKYLEGNPQNKMDV